MSTNPNLSQILQRALAASLLLVVVACGHKTQPDTTVDPQGPQPILQPYPQSDHAPIAPVLGHYQASYYQETSSPVNYPINNQTVELTLTAVSGDTVKVDILAAANGKYSPGKNVTYPKAVVVSKIKTDGTVTYYVYLNQPTTTDCGSLNTLYIYSDYSLDYYFVSPVNQPCIGARIRFTKS